MRIILSTIVSILLLAFLPIPVSAQQPTSLSMSPLRVEAEIAPGFVYSGNFTITNRGLTQQNIDLSAESFGVINQAYDYVFTANTPESSWITFDQSSIVLNKDESASITYQVNVPLDTEPAGYYFALFATHRPSSEATSSIIPSERIGSLLYLTVTGDAFRSGELVQLTSPSVIFSTAQWSAVLQNTGTLHYRSSYTVSVYTPFDQLVSKHEDSRLILPNSVRLIEDTLVVPEILGIYKVVYTIGLGDSPAQQHTRWILSLPILQSILIALIAISLFVLLKRRAN